MNKITNPFIIGKYISDEYFCDRKEETDFLCKQIYNGRNTALISQRRIGKTELIHHFFSQSDIKNEYYTFFLDIYSTSSLTEFVYLFGKTIFKQLKPQNIQVKEKFFTIIKSFRAGFKLDMVTGEPTFDISMSNIDQPQITLEEIFYYLESANKPCIIAIDEFQQITNYEEKNIEALLRTYIQKSKNTIFIFSGSKRHIMTQMFQSASKPFYNSAIVYNLERIKKESYIDFVTRLFNQYNKQIEKQVIIEVYNKYSGITLFMQTIINELFALTKNNETCTTDLITIAENNVIYVQEIFYKETLNQLSTKQKYVLLAIAKEKFAKNVLSGVFIKKYGLLSSSSIQAALKKLLEKDIITETENGYCVYDYFFAEWLRINY